MLVFKALFTESEASDPAAPIPGLVTVATTPTGFTMKSEALALDFEFVLARVAYGPDVMYLTRARSGAWAIVWASELHESRDSWSALMVRKGIDTFNPVVIVGVDATRADFTAIFFCNAIAPAITSPLVDSSGESGDMMLKRLMPSIEPFLQRQWAKHKLLKEVKTNDSLAALEQQLDLLTAVVAQIVKAGAFVQSGVVPVWTQDFLDAATSSSSLTLTDPPAAIAKMSAFKTALRKLQAVYLKVIGQ